MESVLPASPASIRGARPPLRSGEKVLIAYFVYTALLTLARPVAPARTAMAWSLVAAVSGLAWAASRNPRGLPGVLRDWLPLGLILGGYWELQWFASSHSVLWQQTWLEWDRSLLGAWGLRSAIEALGGTIPSLLEGVYLCLYLIPPFCMALLYLSGRRDRIDRFLTTLFLGGFCAYALLPLFPVQSPRVAFPGADLPNFEGVYRSANVWLLNHFDISTSVFPSGHVAVAFSSAFGLRRALPEKPWLSLFLLAVSTMVYIATIYARYHYAVDGLAGAAIAVAAWRSSNWIENHV
jgi:membrane-associated phospholipid phosphatase